MRERYILFIAWETRDWVFNPCTLSVRSGAWLGFFKGGGSHCVKVRVLTRLSCRFHHLLKVVCSKRLTKGGHRHPRTPPPSYAPVDSMWMETVLNNFAFICFDSCNNTTKVFNSTLKHFIRIIFPLSTSNAFQIFLGKHSSDLFRKERVLLHCYHCWRNYHLRAYL